MGGTFRGVAHEIVGSIEFGDYGERSDASGPRWVVRRRAKPRKGGRQMPAEGSLFEPDPAEGETDPDAIPVRDRHVYTQPYDLVVESLLDQIDGGTVFLRPLSERPGFQRRYVWTNVLASRLIESILLNVPIPPCYLSQNENFELDVIDGQQRLYSIYRYLNNQFALTGLEVFTDFNGSRFHSLPSRVQRQLKT
jgi:hypothetical protein